jgi:hypothetical protein
MDSDEIEHGTLPILIKRLFLYQREKYNVYFIILVATLRSYLCFNFVKKKKKGKAVQQHTIGDAQRENGGIAPTRPRPPH